MIAYHTSHHPLHLSLPLLCCPQNEEKTSVNLQVDADEEEETNGDDPSGRNVGSAPPIALPPPL